MSMQVVITKLDCQAFMVSLHGGLGALVLMTLEVLQSYMLAIDSHKAAVMHV